MKKKALIIRFSSIGDIILTTPSIRCLSIQGDYQVDLLTHERFAHVLKDNPYLNKIIAFTEDLSILSRQIIEEEYTVIIDLHKSIRSYLLRVLLRQKVYGFNKLRIKRWWRVLSKQRMSHDRHIALRFVDALKPLGINYDNQGLDFFISEEEQVSLEAHKYDYQIGLVTGANFYTKSIPLMISKKLIEQNTSILFHLIGGKKEITSTAPLNVYDNVFNHCGKISLAQSASVIDQCDLIVTTDTSMMHIASARNKNIIAIFGGTVTDFGFFPLLKEAGNYSIVENNQLHCRPCSKSGRNYCPKGHFKCMNDISTNELQKEIKKQLIMNHL